MDKKLAVRIVLAAGVGALVAGGLILLRGFFPAHAALSGVAVAALVWVSLRTVDQLRGLYRR